MSLFEGSFLGDRDRIGESAVMECGVCWWVYDPSLGDEVWQIPPGTAFTALPEHWRCPHCDAAPSQFMTLRAGQHRKERPGHNAGQALIADKSVALENAYQQAAVAMRALPVSNPRLQVDIIGMRRCAEGLICVATTPWCMNLVLLADEQRAGREGSTRTVNFPSGDYEFVSGFLEGVGSVETCSLFSPMEQFEDPEVVAEVAHLAIEGLFEAPEPAADSGLSRRQFLRPGAAL